MEWKELNSRIQEVKQKLEHKSQRSRDDIHRILRERASAISDVENKAAHKELLPVLSFQIGHEKYAIRLTELKEISNSKNILEIPCTPDYLFGVINLRGKIVSIIDLKVYLGLQHVGISDSTSIVIVDYEKDWIGFVVDEVLGIDHIDPDGLQETLPILEKLQEKFIVGITPENKVVLDMHEIISENQFLINESTPF